LFSCSRDNEENIVEDDLLITKMSRLILYPNSLSYNNAELSFIFHYDNEKNLIEKKGGFFQSSWGTGYEGLGQYFTDKIYTSLVYNGNNVTVEDFSSSIDFTVPKNSKYFILDNNKRIKQKNVPSTVISSYRDIQQNFIYNNIGQLTEINTTLPNMPYDPTDPYDYIETYLEKFYYDSKGNLIKTEYFEQKNGVNKGIKVIRTFEDYDNSYNPWKRMYLLDDFFYRSISKNNFRKYKVVRYEENGDVSLNSQQSWTFNYDSNGNIIIN
jgi:hypothetical protein